MLDDVITHGGVDRAYKNCRCAECGKVRQCTPSHDFYTERDNDNGPLFCYGCLISRANVRSRDCKIISN